MFNHIILSHVVERSRLCLQTKDSVLVVDINIVRSVAEPAYLKLHNKMLMLPKMHDRAQARIFFIHIQIILKRINIFLSITIIPLN